ncbi:DUF3300 domain-containing protein [Thalassotalea sp. PLHSN55]|uniref:DUF3300 domain-containing protein n=1 Tax=Thalassotalea sp. PLHSN55 TaxID=3435888 RepID=UPI003F8753FD
MTIRSIIFTVFVLLISSMTFTVVAQEAGGEIRSENVSANSAKGNQPNDTGDEGFSDDELAQMLAPIALYPDSLLTHILIASTYPLEIVEAERWAQKNKDLSKDEKIKKMEQQDWEPSVKAVVPFDTVLTRLNDELSWTQDLGDAFLQDEAKVLDTIQQLRAKADEAGNLDKMENVEVTKEDDNIIIQPVEKEIVYVPYYDTRYVYGHWHWYHPPVYWIHYPHHHHRPHMTFSWHVGVHISFNYHFGAPHWHNRHVVVVNHRNTHRYRSSTVIIKSGHSKRWAHNPVHRKGVAYRSTSVKKHYGSNRPTTYKSVTKVTKNKGTINSKAAVHSKKATTTHQRVSESLAKSKQATNSIKTAKPPTHSVNNKSNNRVASPSNQASKAASNNAKTYKNNTQSMKAKPVQNRQAQNKPVSTKSVSKPQPSAHKVHRGGQGGQGGQMKKHN